LNQADNSYLIKSMLSINSPSDSNRAINTVGGNFKIIKKGSALNKLQRFKREMAVSTRINTGISN